MMLTVARKNKAQKRSKRPKISALENKNNNQNEDTTKIKESRVTNEKFFLLLI